MRKVNHSRPSPMPHDPVLHALFTRLDATGLTYAHVEKRAGVARGQLHRWRRELVRPRLDLLTCVAQVVGLRLSLT